MDIVDQRINRPSFETGVEVHPRQSVHDAVLRGKNTLAGDDSEVVGIARATEAKSAAPRGYRAIVCESVTTSLVLSDGIGVMKT